MRNILFIVFVLVSVVCYGKRNHNLYIGIEETIFFSSDNDNRLFIYDGMCLSLTKDSITIFATDRISYYVSYSISVDEFKNDMIYSKKKYNEWCKIVKKEKIKDFEKHIIEKENYTISFVNNGYYNRFRVFFKIVDRPYRMYEKGKTQINNLYLAEVMNCIFNFDEIIQKEKDKMAYAIERSKEKEYKLSLLK